MSLWLIGGRNGGKYTAVDEKRVLVRDCRFRNGSSGSKLEVPNHMA